MTTTSEILQTHPHAPTRFPNEIAQAIEACYETARVSTICADACLAEENVADLRECIRLNLDCSDFTTATARMMARQARPVPALWRAALQACIEACKASAAECAKHEANMEHCRVCREACEKSMQYCQAVLDAMPEGGAEAAH